MMKKFKGLLFAGITVASLAFSAQKAEASSGQIVDGNGRPVVGVWVEVKGGGSSWAHLNRTREPHIAGWRYDTKGRDYRLHVGVGGTSQNWGNNIKSGWINGGQTIANVSTNWDWIWGNKIWIS